MSFLTNRLERLCTSCLTCNTNQNEWPNLSLLWLFACKIKVLIESMAQIGTESVFWYHLKLNVQASLLGIFHPSRYDISLSIFPSNCSISKGYGLTDYAIFQTFRKTKSTSINKQNNSHSL